MVSFLEANKSRSIATYSAGSASIVVSTAGATDVWTISGSSSRLIRIQGIRITGESSANAAVDVSIIKRSTNSSGGTSTALTAVSHDSTNPAATATILAYTVNPTTLGSTVGILRSEHAIFAGNSAPNIAITVTLYQFSIYDGQPPTLRSTSEQLCVNLNGIVLGQGNITVDAQWTEE